VWGLKNKGIKNGKSSIAPLQLSALASFRPWGSSIGAGRTDLPPQSYKYFLTSTKIISLFM